MSESDSMVVYVGLGGNLGRSVKIIEKAYVELGKVPETQLVSMSSLYQSKPLGGMLQPDYVNAVACLSTGLSPNELLQNLQLIEDCFGRDRSSSRWSSRTLDLDILLYGEMIIDETTLKIPHPGLFQREFVLAPLSELGVDLGFLTDLPIEKLLLDLPQRGLKKIN